ncbi:MAG: insulinase family protein [Firmicutes bacterium]|nr:insulinase family protein [Bacillota bacterium]
MYDKLTLQNGVRILTEPMPDRRSAALGLWVGAGSRAEAPAEHGAAHFIEHMLFKGTQSRSAADLASAMDGVGGQVNAFTTREKTCFYARVLDTHLELAIDLLTDMFFCSRFDEADVQSERGVIGEEIGMYEDTPDDLVVERAVERSLTGSLSHSVLGSRRSLAGLSPEGLKAFMGRYYTPDRTVIALCGSFCEAHVRRLAEIFDRMKPGDAPEPKPSHFRPVFLTKRRATEQNHICLAFQALPANSETRFAMQFLSSVLGGGVSSRLFQTVREKYGLCYAISDFLVNFNEVGVYGVSAALGRETELKALRLILDELRRLAEDGVTPEELSRAREQVKSSLALSMESTSAVMNKLGAGELVLGRSLSLDELLERYDAVTAEEVLDLARRVLDFDSMTFSAVGRVKAEEEYRQAIGGS